MWRAEKSEKAIGKMSINFDCFSNLPLLCVLVHDGILSARDLKELVNEGNTNRMAKVCRPK